MIESRMKPGRLYIVMVLLLIFVSMTPNSPALANQKKRVLFISSYHPGFPTFFHQVNGIRSVFSEQSISLDIEFMDTKRFYSVETIQIFHNSLKHKLAHIPAYDLLLVADDNAVSFVMENRQDLFPSIPIVFFGVNSPERAKKLGASPNVTGVVEAISMEETIDLMVRLHPEIDQIVAIADGTVTGQKDLQTYHSSQARYEFVAFKELLLSQLSFDELAAKLNRINENSAILLISAFKDRDGQSLSFEDSLKIIRENAPIPIYHLWRHGLGNGILGGKVINHFHQGRKAAELGLLILSGEHPDEISVVMHSPNVYMFDYKQLRRFDIALDDLPRDAEFINRPTSFYSKHKKVLWASFTITISLSVIVVFLYINVVRRKNAELALKESHEQLEMRVIDRTNELAISNAELKNEIHERRRAEKSAVDLTQKLEVAQTLAKSGWWEYDINSDMLIWPDETYAIYGLDPDTTTPGYESLLELIDPDYHEHHNRQMKQMQENGKAEFQYPIERPDGERRWIWASGETDYSNQGSPIRLFGTLQDVTERVQVEEQLRLQAQIIRQVHDSVISVDMEGVITTWNKGSERVFRYPANEAIGKHVALVYPEEAHDRLINEIIPKLLSEGSTEIEATLIRKGNQPFDAIVSLSVLRSDADELTGMIGYTLDISERKQIERALADSERRLADIIEFLPDPTWVIDRDGRVIAWNRAIEKLTRVQKQEILGKGGYAHAVPFYGEPRPVLIDLVMERSDSWENEYVTLEEKDGFLVASESYHPQMGTDGLYLAGTAAKLFDTNGDVVGSIETIRDITDTKRMSQEREKLISELKDALSKVQTLSGFLPICASCKKIRDDQGYWNQIEAYISQHSQAEFSHSICPECAKKLYPGMKFSKE